MFPVLIPSKYNPYRHRSKALFAESPLSDIFTSSTTFTHRINILSCTLIRFPSSTANNPTKQRMAPSTRSSRALYDHFDPGPLFEFEEEHPYTDVEMTIEDIEQDDEECDVMEHDTVSNMERNRIIIAIDFGTTFSSVAYTVLPKGVSPKNVHLRKVHCIGEYPGYQVPNGQLNTRQDVPTELWYDFEDQSPPMDISYHDDDSSSSDEDDTDKGFDDDGGLRMSAAARPTTPRDTSVPQYWGFNVQHHLDMRNIPKDEARPLTRFKLNLDNTENTREVRRDNDPILATLRERNVINDDSEIYTDFLTHLLKHTKERLSKELDEKLSKELDRNMDFQFVLCVPAKWPVQACRTMQNAVEQAVQRTGFSLNAQEAVRNLFMISEPEAAAECVLAEARSDLYVRIVDVRHHYVIDFGSQCDETVVIIDAGGGTIDAVTYKCTNDEPLRLSEEVVAPDSETIPKTLPLP